MLHESPFISEQQVPVDRAWGWKSAFLIVVLLGFLGVRWSLEWDAAGVEIVRTSAHGFWKRIAEQVSIWGDWYGVLTVGLLFWMVAKVSKSASLRSLIQVMALSAVLSGVTANVVRAATGRTRPFAVAAEGWYGPRYGLGLMGPGHPFQSFPSAHTAVVAGFMAPLGWVSLRARRGRSRAMGLTVALGAMGVMAWARVWCGGHHLSDVLASCILGVVMGAVLLERKRQSLPGRQRKELAFGSPEKSSARPLQA